MQLCHSCVLLAASLVNKGEMLFSSIGKRKIKLFLAAFGVILLFASLLESLLFLNHTQPYPLIDFKVDYIGHYFPFYVLTPVGSYFQEWHYVASAINLV